MATKRYYSTEEAIQMILAPASDSELSDIELSDDDDDHIDGRNRHESTIVKPRIGDDAEPDDEIEDNVAIEISLAIEEDTAIADNDETIRKDQDRIRISDYQDRKLRWRNTVLPMVNTEFLGQELSLPPDDYDTWTPLSYFKLFQKDDLNVILSEQTNMYIVQRKGTSIAVTPGEVQQFIGLQMYVFCPASCISYVLVKRDTLPACR